jgi:hypothetical protein
MLVSEVIDRTFSSWLYPGGIQRPAFDTLASTIDNSQLTLTLSGRVTNVPRDSVLEIDYEQMLVSSVVTTAVILQERGYLETDPVLHLSGAMVGIDPTYTRKAVFDALVAVLKMLYPAGCYWRAEDSATTFSFNSPLKALPTGGRRVVTILAKTNSVIEDYRPLRAGIDYVNRPEFTPSRYRLRRGGFEGGAMLVIYAKDFGVPTAPTDDLDTLGVPASLQPHLPMGIAGQLLQGRELPRIQIEEIRRFMSSQGIQVGAALNVGQALLNTFMQRHVGGERTRLDEKDPSSFEFVRV